MRANQPEDTPSIMKTRDARVGDKDNDELEMRELPPRRTRSERGPLQPAYDAVRLNN